MGQSEKALEERLRRALARAANQPLIVDNYTIYYGTYHTINYGTYSTIYYAIYYSTYYN